MKEKLRRINVFKILLKQKIVNDYLKLVNFLFLRKREKIIAGHIDVIIYTVPQR